MEERPFTTKEETLHAMTHGVGVIFSLVGFILLTVLSYLHGDIWELTSVLIFGFTMVLMYLMSTIVHSLPYGKMKDLFQIFDHASIYLFIAGSYTPFLLVHLHGKTGFIFLAIIWSIAITGVTLKIFFTKRFFILSTVIYIIMGWLIIFVWKPLTNSLSMNGMILLVAGGIVYTVGALFFMWRSLPYHHVIWHLFVMIGSAFHFFAVFFHVL